MKNSCERSHSSLHTSKTSLCQRVWLMKNKTYESKMFVVIWWKSWRRKLWIHRSSSRRRWCIFGIATTIQYWKRRGCDNVPFLFSLIQSLFNDFFSDFQICLSVYFPIKWWLKWFNSLSTQPILILSEFVNNSILSMLSIFHTSSLNTY